MIDLYSLSVEVSTSSVMVASAHGACTASLYRSCMVVCSTSIHRNLCRHPHCTYRAPHLPAWCGTALHSIIQSSTVLWIDVFRKPTRLVPAGTTPLTSTLTIGMLKFRCGPLSSPSSNALQQHRGMPFVVIKPILVVVLVIIFTAVFHFRRHWTFRDPYPCPWEVCTPFSSSPQLKLHGTAVCTCIRHQCTGFV